ncbi:hypothetical protein ACROYT_G035017 [Oculina patagonica]
MGARMTKPAEGKEKGKLFGNSRSQKNRAKKQIRADRHSFVDNTKSSAGVPVKRKTLKELQKECPLGFKKFELEIGLESIDEEIALQLWEDVYRP